MKNLKFLVKKANESLKEAILYIESVQECFGRMDLKLHGLSYALWKDERFAKYEEKYLGDMFDLFCQDNYDFFCEWEEEEGINSNIRQYIGRTSTFVLDSRGVFEDGELYLYNVLNGNFNEYLNYGCADWLDSCIECKLGVTEIDYTTIQKYISSVRNEWIEEEIAYIKESMQYIISGTLLENIKYFLEDGIKEYNYIKDFKENSVEYFIEFLEAQEGE